MFAGGMVQKQPLVVPGASVPTGWPVLPPQGPPIPERVPGWEAPGGQAVLPAANAGQAQNGDNLGMAIQRMQENVLSSMHAMLQAEFATLQGWTARTDERMQSVEDGVEAGRASLQVAAQERARLAARLEHQERQAQEAARAVATVAQAAASATRRVEELEARLAGAQAAGQAVAPAAPRAAPASAVPPRAQGEERFVPSCIFLSGWAKYDEEEAGLTEQQCDELVQELAQAMDTRPLVQQALRQPDAVRAPRLRNTRIRVNLEGGRDFCFRTAKAVREVVQSRSMVRNGKTIKVRVEDSPRANEQRSVFVKALRVLESRVPSAGAKPDWPNKIYAHDLSLLARVPYQGPKIEWIVPNLQAFAAGITAADLDEALERM